MSSQGATPRPRPEASRTGATCSRGVGGSLACLEQIERIVLVLSRYRFRAQNEADLQDAVASALELARIPFAREVRLDARNRLDFMVERIALELKVDGSLSNLTRQVHRYLEDDRVEGILIVSTRSNHRRLPLELRGKPVRALIVGGVL